MTLSFVRSRPWTTQALGVRTLVLAVPLALAASRAVAAPGDLDPTFAGVGHSTVGFGFGEDLANQVALQSDGKAVVIGTTARGIDKDFVLARYDVNGALDTTFGSDGYVTTDFGTVVDAGQSVGWQSDGKLVAVGSTSDASLLVARYNADGSLDPTLDGDGRLKTIITPAASAFYFDVALQFDGKVVVCGQAEDDLVVVRLNADGSPDTSFGTLGVVRSDVLTTTRLEDVVILADGRILAAGTTSATPGFSSMCLVRLNSNGTFDTTFSGDGKAEVGSAFGLASGNVLALQISASQTKYMIGGSISAANATNSAIACFNADGSLDTSFDGDGFLAVSLTSGIDEIRGLRILYASGNPSRILACGRATTPASPYFEAFVAKFFLAGGLDASFDGDGFVALASAPWDDSAESITLTNTGKILTVGYSYQSSQDFALARRNADGSPDLGWDADGVRYDDFGDGVSEMRAVAVQPDGRIVSGGKCVAGSDVRLALARHLEDGSLDLSFGVGGRVVENLNGADETIYGLAMQPDGKIVAVGSAGGDGAMSDLVVVRFRPDGLRDLPFATLGIARPGWIGPDRATAVAIQPDGKILVSGCKYIGSSSPTVPIVVRFESTGALDSTFGTGGIAVANVFNGLGSAQAVALAPDGKIIIAGLSADEWGIGTAFFAARFTAGGSLDATFDSDGITIAPLHAAALSVAIQPDGRIIAGGQRVPEGGDVLVRWEESGAADPTFGSFGVVSVSPGVMSEGLRSLRLQANGRVVAISDRLIAGFPRNVVLRCMPNGSLDPTFGSGGIATCSFGTQWLETARALELDTQNRIALVGSAAWLASTARLQNDTATDAAIEEKRGVDALRLGLPFPNPARGTVTAHVESTRSAPIRAAVFDIAGRRVRFIDVPRGSAADIRWNGERDDGARAAPGVYFLSVRQGAATQTRPITLLR